MPPCHYSKAILGFPRVHVYDDRTLTAVLSPFRSVFHRSPMHTVRLWESSLTSEWKRWVLARSLMIAVSFHLSAFMSPQRFSLGCCLLNWDWLKQYESYIQRRMAEREICSFRCLSVLLLSFFDRPWGLVTVSQMPFIARLQFKVTAEALCTRAVHPFPSCAAL